MSFQSLYIPLILHKLACMNPRSTDIDIIKTVERKNVIIFLPIAFNICFGCPKEPSHRDGSFEYSQHMFWLRNMKIKFLLQALN